MNPKRTLTQGRDPEQSVLQLFEIDDARRRSDFNRSRLPARFDTFTLRQS